MAKEGNKQVNILMWIKLNVVIYLVILKACVILAKQLVQLRNQETRSIAASSRINGIKTHTQVNIMISWKFN